MADTNHDGLVSQFAEITGASTERAQFFLESANWQLQLALASFYENTDSANEGDDARVEDVVDDDDDDSMGAASLPSFRTSQSAGAKPKKDKKKNKQNATGPRIMTLNNMSSSDDEEEDEQRGQAFYAGGSERSGQQVLGPPRKNPTSDFVADIFKSAQESGAEVVENPEKGSQSNRLFTGTSYRLGQTNDDHVVLPESGRANRPQSIEPVVLRLWRQGFTINEGELRAYDDPRNKDFLECIARGQLPPELRQRDGNTVQVNMEDHRHEDYKPTAPKSKPFAGKGHTLGSPTPNVKDESSSSATSVAVSPGDNETNEKRANDELKLSASEPTTSLQIRLADGSRLAGRFNNVHTIADLRRFICTARPQYSGRPFALLTTFPSKELTEETQTIEKAGLLNAAIMQRLK